MKKYLNIFLKRRLTLIFIFALSAIGSIMVIATTYLGGIFVDNLIEATHINEVFPTLLIFIGISILSILLQSAASLVFTPTKERIKYDMKIYIFNNISNKDSNSVYNSKSIDEDTTQITSFFMDNYSMTLIKAIEIIVVGFIVFSINWHIGIIMLVICPIYFGLYVLFRKPIFNKSLHMREKSAEFFRDYTSALELKREEDFIGKSFLSYFRKYKEYLIVNVMLNSSQSFILGAVQIIIFFIGGMAVINGYTTIGLLSILMIYFNQVIGNISYYLNLSRMWQVTNASINRLDTIINQNSNKG